MSNIILTTPSELERIIAQAIEKALQFMNQSSTNKYANDSFLGGLARGRGTQINTDFAEAVEVLRTVM
jgi:hypothetical protein